MDVVKNVSGSGLVEFGEENQCSIMSNRELENGEEFYGDSLEVTKCPITFLYIPSSC